MADYSNEGSTLVASTPLADWLTSNSKVDLGKVKNAVNYGEGKVADAFSQGLSAKYGYGPVDVYSNIDANLGTNRDLYTDAGVKYSKDGLYLEGNISKKNLDQIDQAITNKQVRAAYDNGPVGLSGNYYDTKLPFGGKAHGYEVEGKYSISPELDAIARYGNRSGNEAELMYKPSKNSTISANYRDNGTATYGVNFGVNF